VSRVGRRPEFGKALPIHLSGPGYRVRTDLIEKLTVRKETLRAK
jgi:hypothetical protein